MHPKRVGVSANGQMPVATVDNVSSLTSSSDMMRNCHSEILTDGLYQHIRHDPKVPNPDLSTLFVNCQHKKSRQMRTERYTCSVKYSVTM